ncbi:MAG: hypothetical protein JXR83_01030 [Deltaproteobacteria bacterium]|nr:hypothetical protein [Deltaproteobacteria bacterium]
MSERAAILAGSAALRCAAALVGLASVLAPGCSCEAPRADAGQAPVEDAASRPDSASLPDAGHAEDSGSGPDRDGATPDGAPADAAPDDGASPDRSGPDASHSIYGIFGWSAGAAAAIMSGKQGFSVEFLRSEVEWADSGWWNSRMNDYAAMIAEGFTPITRLSYGPSMMPADPALCDGTGGDDFAQRAAAMAVAIRDRHGAVARRFIVGNEPNHPAEGELDVADYARCYLQVYQKIKAAWPAAVVMPAAVAPWAPKDYDCQGNSACTGLGQPWLRYYFGLVLAVGAAADAYDMHTYGGRDGDRDPYDDGNSSFGAFEVALAANNAAYPNHKPVYITEFNNGANGNAYSYDGSWAGFVQAAYRRVNDYNSQAGAGRVRSLCWFTYDLAGWEFFNLTSHDQARSDFQWTTANTSYRAP